ncbi:hypothetical protein BDZ97DRAFT_1913306 [Flammula alnicola]|nr:hypothetical protein BDZ97DRAFT_1913306 [Flammula alnicola]
MDARLNALSILVGLTNNTADVMANTAPTPVVPGLSLCGGASRSFRRRFVSPSTAAFGLFESSRTFLVTNVIPLFPDPSPPSKPSPEIWTPRIFGQNDF